MRTTREINEWRKANPGKRLDLIEADLIGANLIGAKLIGADLRGAILCNANLDGAKISYRGKIVTIKFIEEVKS